MLVVGASAAGPATAEALRRKGYPGELTPVGDEVHPPHDRPPLSKRIHQHRLSHLEATGSPVSAATVPEGR